MMKRGRESELGELNATLTLANCLMLLSRGGGAEFGADPAASGGDSPTRVFECKTCNRQFTSFQALGGHRASHKKPRQEDCSASRSSPALGGTKPKTHECSICGLVFSIGQALGGHMRRHRTASSENQRLQQPIPFQAVAQLPAPDVEKTGSRRWLRLDLNLTPMENELEFRIDKVATPAVIV